EQVQRLALRHAFKERDIDQHDVAQFPDGGPVGARRADISGPDDADLGASHSVLLDLREWDYVESPRGMQKGAAFRLPIGDAASKVAKRQAGEKPSLAIVTFPAHAHNKHSRSSTPRGALSLMRVLWIPSAT